MQLRLALVALLAAGASALVAPPLAARPMPVARAATDAVVMGAARSVGRLPAKKAVAKRAAPKKVAPKKVVKKVAPKKVAPKKPVASRAAPAKKVRPRHRRAALPCHSAPTRLCLTTAAILRPLSGGAEARRAQAGCEEDGGGAHGRRPELLLDRQPPGEGARRAAAQCPRPGATLARRLADRHWAPVWRRPAVRALLTRLHSLPPRRRCGRSSRSASSRRRRRRTRRRASRRRSAARPSRSRALLVRFRSRIQTFVTRDLHSDVTRDSLRVRFANLDSVYP